MVQGTTSHAGKTILVAALCRILSERGLKVAPFKSQNMSLNSYVTEDGREIARAQALQAFAAGIEPRVEMNPILLKPKGEKVSQVILHGKPFADVETTPYGEFARSKGAEAVKRSLSILRSEFDVVVIEGAGSPAEINLYDRDITTPTEIPAQGLCRLRRRNGLSWPAATPASWPSFVACLKTGTAI